MRRVTWKELLSVNAYWFGLSFMWNSLHVLVLPAVLLTYVPDARKNTVLGLLTFVGLIVAMIVQPISGGISDRWASRWGRRRPLLAGGTLLDVLFLGIMAFAGGLAGLAIGYVGLQFTSNIAHGPAQGLMHDEVPVEKMGLASGIKNLMDMGGMIVSSLLVGSLFSVQKPLGTYGLIIAFLLLGGAITVFAVRERSTILSAARESLLAALRVDIHAHGAYWRLILSRLLFLIGIYGVQSFAQYYVQDTLRPENPVQLTGTLLATIVLSLIAFSLLAGHLCDRWGRKPMHWVAAGMAIVGNLLMITAKTEWMVLLYGSIIGAGIGVFISANWALANDLAPQGEAGKFLGLTNIATAGSAALGRLAGPMIDALNGLRPGAYLGYSALFASAAFLSLCGAIALHGVPDIVRKSEEGKAGSL
jgi:MFS family permease